MTSSMFWVCYEVNTCFQFDGKSSEENREVLRKAMQDVMQKVPGSGSWKVVDENHVEDK